MPHHSQSAAGAGGARPVAPLSAGVPAFRARFALDCHPPLTTALQRRHDYGGSGQRRRRAREPPGGKFPSWMRASGPPMRAAWSTRPVAWRPPSGAGAVSAVRQPRRRRRRGAFPAAHDRSRHRRGDHPLSQRRHAGTPARLVHGGGRAIRRFRRPATRPAAAKALIERFTRVDADTTPRQCGRGLEDGGCRRRRFPAPPAVRAAPGGGVDVRFDGADSSAARRATSTAGRGGGNLR